MQTMASMPMRSLAVAALLLVAACGPQDAEPFVAPDPEAFASETGALRVLVRRDTARSATTAKLAPAPSVSVRLIPEGDTVAIRQLPTNSAGEVLFVGLAPGNYVIEPVVRSGSIVTTSTATVAAADTVADTVQVRVASVISGFVGAQFTTQERFETVRYAGVKVRLLRDNGTGTFVPVDSVTTGVSGAFSFTVLPSDQNARLEFNSADITALTDPLLTFQGTGAVPYVKRVETVNITNITPDRSITQNLLFQYNSRIVISPYRDTDKDDVRDTGEGMLAGDTVFFQLRNADGTRVLLSGTSLRAVAATNGARPTVTVNNLQAGTYRVTADPALSRFPQTPFLFTAASFPTYTVVIEQSSSSPLVADTVLYSIKAP